MKKQFLYLLLLSVFAFTACKKSSTTTSNSGPYSTMSSVYSMLKPQSVMANMDAGTGGTIIGRTGTRYVFPANAYINDATGATVTGNVVVEVNEYLTKGDMIFSGVLPFSNGNALFSGGELYVNITKNYQRVSLKPYNFYQAIIPPIGTADVSGMGLFYGNSNLPNNANTVNWILNMDTASGYLYYNGDTINVISDSLGFCNADRFMTNPNYQTFKLNITGLSIPVDSTVMVYALYDNYKGVWNISNTGGNVINVTHIPNIPVHFAVFTLSNGNFYGGVLGVTPQTDSSYTINLTQTSPTAYKAQLDGL
jgi:hypothetical protein